MTLHARILAGALSLAVASSAQAASSLPPYVPPLAAPSARAPGAADDTTKGAAIGDIWLGPTGLLQATGVGAGAATWQPSTIYGGLPLDVAPNAAFAGSLYQLSSAYTANKAADITRQSDGTTLTVGFRNGEFDFGTADAFVAGTQGYITRLYDQSSTGGIVGASFVYAGYGYTAVPTVSFTDPNGTGSGAAAAAAILGLSSLATQTVASGGAGCTNGVQTFTLAAGTVMAGSLADGTAGAAAQVTGTVTGGALSGALTIVTNGLYAAPTFGAVALTGGGCTTAPTINASYGVLGIQITAAGTNYAAPTPTTAGPSFGLTGGSPTSAATPSTVQVKWTLNGKDATNASLATAPAYTTNTVQGRRAIDFSPWLRYPGTTAPQSVRYLNLDATLSLTPSLLTAIVAGQVHSTVATNTVATVGPTATNVLSTAQYYVTNPVGMGFQSGQFATPNVGAPISPTVFLWYIRSGASVFKAGNTTGTLANGQSATAVTGGTIGSASGNVNYGLSDMSLASIVLYSRAMSQTEANVAQAATYARFGYPGPQLNDVILAFDGDSITYGYRSLLNLSYGRMLAAALVRPVKAYSVAVSGNAIVDASSLFPRSYGTIYDARAAAAKLFLVNLLIGVNTIGYANPTAGSGATAYSQLGSYIGQIKAKGANVRVNCATILPRVEGFTGSGSYNGEINAFNASLRAGYPAIGCDALTDLAADPTIGNPNATTTPTAPGNRAVYQADGVHLTDYGMSIQARLFAATAGAVIQQVAP